MKGGAVKRAFFNTIEFFLFYIHTCSGVSGWAWAMWLGKKGLLQKIVTIVLGREVQKRDLAG